MSQRADKHDRPTVAEVLADRFGLLARGRSGERRVVRFALLWGAIVLGVVVAGTAGYIVLLGWSIGDAAYMTVITLTTVGFEEVRKLDGVGRAWTSLLAIAGVAIIFGTVGLVAESFVAEAVSGRLEKRRMAEAVEKLSGHFILCGYGRVGSTVARELVHSKAAFVVVDFNPSSVEQAARDGMLVVAGDATRDSILEQAGIRRAGALITTTDSDVNNVYVTLSARALNPDLFIVARANDEQSEAKLTQAGANRVVSPYSRAGRQIAEVALRPRVADFLDFAMSHGELSFSIEEYEVTDGDPLAGKTVAVVSDRGIHTLAIAHGPQDYETNPQEDRQLVPGDHLILSGTGQALNDLRADADRKKP
jgi:voltage-gated potassium channel